MQENISYVRCKICKRKMRTLVPHLYSKHNLTVKKYKDIYPKSVIVCKETRDIQRINKQKHKLRCMCAACMAKRGEAYNKGLRGRKLKDMLGEERARQRREKHRRWFKDEEKTKNWKKSLRKALLRRHQNMSIEKRRELSKNISNAKIDWDFYNKYGTLKSKYPYASIMTKEFCENIRERDNYTCQVTGITDDEHIKKHGSKLHVHHWTYNKDETNPFYFITVSKSVNSMANSKNNQMQWIDMFNGIMEDKYCGMLKDEVLVH